ncbi:MAG: mycofactocin biosynthesis chaperone MftB [Actinomycetota bacterium]
MSTELSAPPLLDGLLSRPLELHPQVALRPEPFGALAYHYGNRRLVFLKHPDVVTVARELANHPSLAAALLACGIDRRRWPSFVTAFQSLQNSQVVVERNRP